MVEASCSQSRGRSLPERQPVNRLSTEGDTVLIERVLAGDNGVFEVLMERYAPMVLSYLCGNMQSYHDREDLLQEIFFSAYSRLRTLRRPDRFGPWLMKIARNRHIDFQLKQSSRQRMLLAARRARAMRGFSGLSIRPDDKVSAEQTTSLVQTAISQMRGTYATILYMRLIGGDSPQEIARRLGLKESTVRMRLLRGLKKLRKTLEKQSVTSGEVL